MPVQGQDLFLMTCGAIPPNPTEILNSRKMAELIGAAEKEFDYILVDSPPLLALSDARVLSRLIQDILLIYRYADTNIRLTLESIDSLKNSHSSIVGLVLNGLNPHNESYHYKYHYFPE
jgi:protein-tyrosine kinase